MPENCENCTKCLDYIDAQCLKYTGDSYPDIGVNNGDNIVQVLDKISTKVKEIADAQKESEDCS